MLTCKCHIQTGFKTNLLKCLKVLKKNIKRIEDIQDAVMNLQGIIIRYNIQKNIISDILLTQSHEKAD